jgi:hypothetical protein
MRESMMGRSWVGVLVVLACATGGGCDGCGRAAPIGDLDLGLLPDGGTPVEDLGPTFPDTGIGSGELVITRVVPAHGPYVGGNTAVLRGSGFSVDAVVTFGGRLVQPADYDLIDTRRLQVVVPAGEVGPADVAITLGGTTVTLTDGYTYDALYVQPERGSVAGGTFVTIDGSGTSFATGDTVTFGRSACTDVTVVSATRLTCKTPPLAAGTVDVTVTHTADASTLVAGDAYTYYDASDPYSGGLGGGPVNGSVNITVLNATTGDAVDGATVFLGDVGGPYVGDTDLGGRITFSGPDLLGAQVVTGSKFCFEKTTFVAADASDVTMFLVPWTDPACGTGSGPPPPPGPGRNGAFISGSLIWRGPREFSPNPWINIPPARADEIKVAYVYATQANIDAENPDPASGGAIQRVLEEIADPLPGDERGYPYRIFVRPGAMAVYALSGLENTTTGLFIPYVMGIARNVLAGPGEEVRDQDMVMNITLDHSVDVALSELPAPGRSGPNRFKVRAAIDLGGEGVIMRVVNGVEIDTLRRRTNDRAFRLVSQPALFDALSDGRYRVEAGWFTGDYDSMPYTEVVRTGIIGVDRSIPMTGFLGIPTPTAPEYGAPLPADRILRWTADGPTPSLHIVLMTGGDGNPAWRQFLPGDVREAPIPDTTSLGVADIAAGDVYWQVYAVTIPGFDFDTFTYSYLSDRYWEKSAVDFFTAQAN